jgi:hypothetical protein
VVTLDRLVNVLGSYGVRLRFCPIPRSTELRSVVMHEVTEDRTVVGDVLLGIGARSVKEAVRWAAAARAVVVLIRGGRSHLRIGVGRPRNRIRAWPNGSVRIGRQFG